MVKQVYCAYKARALHNARRRLPHSMYLAPLMVGLLLQGALKFCRTLPVAVQVLRKAFNEDRIAGVCTYCRVVGTASLKVRLGHLDGYLLR